MSLVFFKYIYWHYTAAIPTLVSHIGNAVSFLWQFFSIPQLLRTLFSPWHRLHESYKKGFDIKDAISTFIINTLMRAVGAVVRLVIVCVGIVIMVAAGVAGSTAIILWLLFPAVIGGIIGVIVYFMV